MQESNRFVCGELASLANYVELMTGVPWEVVVEYIRQQPRDPQILERAHAALERLCKP